MPESLRARRGDAVIGRVDYTPLAAAAAARMWRDDHGANPNAPCESDKKGLMRELVIA